jgi:hypothetical protein
LCFLFFEFWGFWKIRQNTCEGWVLLGSFLYLHLHVKFCSQPNIHSCVFYVKVNTRSEGGFFVEVHSNYRIKKKELNEH